MKKLSLLLALSAVVLFCSFAPADWIVFQHKEGKFKASFPRQPVASVQTVDEGDIPLVMNIFLYDASKYKDDNEAYLVMYCDYPDTLVSSDFKDEILNEFFKSGTEGAAKNMNGKIVSVKTIKYKEFPGRKVKINIEGQGIAYLIMYLVNSRAYILEVACDPLKDNNASIEKFFSSFALTDDKKQ